MNKDAIIKVDVMIGDRFYLTFRYKHPRIFILKMKDIIEYAELHYPSIVGKKYRLVLYE